MHRWNQRLLSRIIPVVVLVISAVAPFLPSGAEAAGFQQAYLRLERMRINTATGGLVCAQASVASLSMTDAEVIVAFPSTYTLNETEANWVVTNTNLPAGASFWPGMTSGTTVATLADNSAKTVAFPSGDISSSATLYCFNFASVNTLTTAGSAANSQQASIETENSSSATIDFTQIALANTTDDRITVTAVVPPSFVFTLSAFTDTFTGNLDPLTIVSTSGVTATVTTNAKGGWIAWARDSQQGLTSATAGYTIPTAGTIDGSPNTLVAGTEGYVMDVDITTQASGGCTVAIDAEYNGLTTSAGGTLSGSYQPIAACTGVSPATANGDVITLIERAAISGATPASSDYSDIITVVGAGNF